METIFERTITAIQHDRLTNFIKESDSYLDTCFQYSMVNCFNYLYPRMVISRKIDEIFQSRKNKGEGMSLRNFLGEVKSLEPILRMKVERIVNHSEIPNEDIIDALSVPSHIPVLFGPPESVIPVPEQVAGIVQIFNLHAIRNHLYSLTENLRHQEFGYPMGGYSEYNLYEGEYLTGATFVMVKSNE